MSTTPAKILANRANALKSSGPKTAEGKARARANAYKHGMTGEGIARPEALDGPVEARITSFAQPLVDVVPTLARRFGVLNERLERLERHDKATASKRVRDARSNYLEQRQQAVDALVKRLDDEPDVATRQLTMTPEGCTRLLGLWGGLARDLSLGMPWTNNHRDLALKLLGRLPGAIGLSEVEIFTNTMTGSVRFVPHDPADPHHRDPARLQLLRETARGQMAQLVGREIAGLEALNARFSEADLSLDVLEANDRAEYDESPQSVLFRRYELSTERSLFKTLHLIEQATPQPQTEPQPQPQTEPQPQPEPQPEPQIVQDARVEVAEAAPVASFGAAESGEPDHAPTQPESAPGSSDSPAQPSENGPELAVEPGIAALESPRQHFEQRWLRPRGVVGARPSNRGPVLPS